MKHSEFKIRMAFWCSDRHWRCTDAGMRTIIAIRIDEVVVETLTAETNILSKRVLNYAEAQADNWFIRPPYAVAETVFDEYDFKGCSLEREAKP